jgi:hypothetical protein
MPRRVQIRTSHCGDVVDRDDQRAAGGGHEQPGRVYQIRLANKLLDAWPGDRTPAPVDQTGWNAEMPRPRGEGERAAADGEPPKLGVLSLERGTELCHVASDAGPSGNDWRDVERHLEPDASHRATARSSST